MKATEFADWYVTEDAQKLKGIITGLIKQTDDEALLNKVYNALKSGDVSSRLAAALNQDLDAKKFLDVMTQVVLNTEGTVDEKMMFAENFANGFVDIGSTFSGKKIGLDACIAPGFQQRVFLNLVPIIKQGVGPGEVAFSVMSPSIRFTGQEVGGGDLEVAGVGFVELKTEQSSGGRWINPRKARMNLGKIREALLNLAQRQLPDRINVKQWVQLREYLKANGANKKQMIDLAKLMADATFNHVDNSYYVSNLLSGTAEEIITAITIVGYNNYKAYSGFDGMLIMSVPKKSLLYFSTIDQAMPHLKITTSYVLAPEGEMMPKISVIL
jgi:hypothetical protein